MEIKLTYSDYKTHVLASSTKNLQYQHILTSTGDYKYYFLFAPEGNNILYVSYINEVENASDVTDYETNYATYANKSIIPVEAETGLPKTKPRPVEGTLYLPFIQFTTGDSNSLTQPVSPNNFWSINTSTGGLTKLLAEPEFSYYLDGGGIELIGTSPTNDTYVKVILAPDPPQGYPGNVVLVDNKKIIRDDEIFLLEAPPKYVKYYEALPYANKILLEVTHNESESIDFEFFMRFFI